MELLWRVHHVISWQSLPLDRELASPDIGDKVVSCESLHSLSSEILAGYHSKDGFPVQQTGVANIQSLLVGEKSVRSARRDKSGLFQEPSFSFCHCRRFIASESLLAHM